MQKLFLFDFDGVVVDSLFYPQISFDVQDSLVVYSGHQKANYYQYVIMRLLISCKAVVELNGRSIKNLHSRAYKELLIKLPDKGHKQI